MTRNALIATVIASAAMLGATRPVEARQLRAAVPVEYSAANGEHVRLAEQLQTLRTGARLDLDLQLDLEASAERVASLGAAGGKGRALRRSVEIGDEAGARIQEITCLTDLTAPLNYTKQNYFRLKLFENFDHVVFKVYPGDKADFPANDAACVFAENAPGKKRFHLRGRYQAIVSQTPKGVLVQLRPVR